MKTKYTKKQITEAIKHWEKVLEQIDEKNHKKPNNKHSVLPVVMTNDIDNVFSAGDWDELNHHLNGSSSIEEVFSAAEQTTKNPIIVAWSTKTRLPEDDDGACIYIGVHNSAKDAEATIQVLKDELDDDF